MSNIFIAKSADVIGKVKLGKDANIWYQAVLRGDYNTIEIGEKSNIQDGSVVHVDTHSSVQIGKNVTVGHNCIIHGCQISDNVLVGMGSTIMNNVKIGANTIIGANSLITENKDIPANSLVMGSPAKVIKTLTPEQIESIQKNADLYVENAKNFKGKAYDVSSDGWLTVEEA